MQLATVRLLKQSVLNVALICFHE